MKNFLFPHVFRPIGWLLFVPTLILGILTMAGVISVGGRITEIVFNDFVIIGIVLGALFIGCSRERIEDEMTSAIRLNALLTALYTYVVFLVIWTLAINGIAYFYVMAASLVMLPLMFVARFKYEMHRYYKMQADEEQD